MDTAVLGDCCPTSAADTLSSAQQAKGLFIAGIGRIIASRHGQQTAFEQAVKKKLDQGKRVSVGEYAGGLPKTVCSSRDHPCFSGREVAGNAASDLSKSRSLGIRAVVRARENRFVTVEIRTSVARVMIHRRRKNFTGTRPQKL
jgi:hypothetical protein